MDEFTKYGPRGKRSGQGRLPKNPYDAYEIVRYTFDDGTESLRRYFRSTMRMREDFRRWVGSGEIWPDEMVEWWLRFMAAQAKLIESQNPGKIIVDYDLVTGEFLGEEATSGGTDSGA